MKRLPHLIDLFLALLTLVAVYQVTTRIYEGVPHIEDEVAYSWQAALYTRNQLAIESPPCPRCFLTPFVVDYNGLRFSKYPPGWPAVLSLGVRLNVRDWVNPLLAALCVWLTYRLVSRLTRPVVGILAALLTLTSPFFLLNAGTLLSHIWSFFLTLAFLMAWLEIINPQSTISRWISILLGGFSLGLLALTRQLTVNHIPLDQHLTGRFFAGVAGTHPSAHRSRGGISFFDRRYLSTGQIFPRRPHGDIPYRNTGRFAGGFAFCLAVCGDR